MKIAFHTLGCKVNQYESEAMAKLFREKGHEIVGEREFADVYVINTCTVTAVADKKSRQYIRRMKKVNPDSIIAVTGCYAQIDPEAVSAIEGVDIVTGTNEKSTLPEYVEQFAGSREDRAKAGAAAREEDFTVIRDWKDLDTYEDTGIVTSAENRTRAYIKIQEGCNRFCSYCVIPYARGNIRSRELEEIVQEAEQLIGAGYKEIVLTGINTALYGYDDAAGSQPQGVERVIAALNELPGNFRIRLSSLEPAVVNADYVRRLLKYDRLCHHLHLSAQSGSDRILKAMNRPYDRSQYLQIVDAVRSFDPWYGISTDIIVGFPGEREQDFEDSVSLVQICDFCRVHAFKYSRRPKTAAAAMKEQVSPQVKNRRSDLLQEAGGKAASSFCMKNLGRQEIVLIEEYLPQIGMLTGYTGNYIRAYIRCSAGEGEELLNTFRQVKLTETFRDGCIALIL
ncbi:MAG: tRNA (N(6)-L-threonylcarbamoyladenosine(37)-C(2))-methylthiotransferase MtaB [Firmicutes bacterium]|nr:tRNA (N(6)-L-threonylcarbamoyladenosine(37)-C(2))-methylthiotransferase MtaB [Bacillota bacterium]